jgi:hypothetical protein
MGTTGGPMKMDLGGTPDMGMGAGMIQIGRWTLYDKDGTFVKSLATPYPYQGPGKVDFGVYEFACTYITFWDTDYIGMIFDLATGNPKPCYTNYNAWKESNSYFKDANCTQPAMLTIGGSYPPTVLQVAGSFYYASSLTPVAGSGYVWNKEQNTCTDSGINLPGYSFHEYKPVPNWVLEIMDSPPYSMVLEY